MLNGTNELCTGYILSQGYGIVEASCVYGYNPSSLTVIAGGTLSSTQQIRNIGSIDLHPVYSPPSPTANVAILKISPNLIFNSYVNPITDLASVGFGQYSDWVCSASGTFCNPHPTPTPRPTLNDPTSIQLRLIGSGEIACKGHLLDKAHGISAASCFDDISADQFLVVAGGSVPRNQQFRRISSIIKHENYNPITGEYDVAILKLDDSLVFNEFISAIESIRKSAYVKFADWICEKVGICESVCPAGQAPVSVFQNGPENGSLTKEICVGNLGQFNPTTGIQTGTNYNSTLRAYVLDGKFVKTAVPQNSLIPRFSNAANDFRLNPAGSAHVPARQSSIWSSEAHLYYYINNYRMQILKSGHIQSLGLSATAANKLLNQPVTAEVRELTTFAPFSTSIVDNKLIVPTKQRSEVTDALNSFAFDPEYVVGEYAGLVANWISSSGATWPIDPNFGNISAANAWRNDVRPAILEGFKLWAAHRYSGRTELYKYASRVMRRWNNRTCDTPSTVPCNKGRSIDNVMMYSDTANPFTNTPASGAALDDTILFPYMTNMNDMTAPGNRTAVAAADFGPKNAALAGMFVAGVFYDISKEAGLGAEKSDKIFWKTMSLIDPGQPMNMTQFAATVQQAARALFPATTGGLSLYENDIVDVFSSRGVRMNGNTGSFLNNRYSDNSLVIPVALGQTSLPAPGTQNPGPGSLIPGPGTSVGFGSSVPETQGNSATGYDSLAMFTYGYRVPNSGATLGTQYVTYQMYKFSKYGPCDSLLLTTGLISSANPQNLASDALGAMNTRYEGRALGNTVISSPGTDLIFLRNRQSCINERDGFYAEDMRPIGFKAFKAIPNGFTFKVTKLAHVPNGRISYQLNIVDPSLAMTGANTGAATYSWAFTEYNGVVANRSGQQITYDALIDQPFTVTVARTRTSTGTTDSITLRERGNDFDRNSGEQFSQDFVSLGAKVGFDTIGGRRLLENRGGYNSALNTSGGAFGVQARRWTTPTVIGAPSAAIQPLKFSTVSSGIAAAGNPSYRFQQVTANTPGTTYYNACIWGAREDVTSQPGCVTFPSAGAYEHQVPFASVGINIAQPYVTAVGNLPGYLWTVNYPSTWRLETGREYHFGSHIASSETLNGHSYNLCSLIYADGTAGSSNDRSDWLAGSHWSGTNGNPSPQTMRQFLANANAQPNCTYAAYKFEGKTVAN